MVVGGEEEGEKGCGKWEVVVDGEVREGLVL